MRREINHFREVTNNKTAELVSDLKNSNKSLQKLQKQSGGVRKRQSQLEHVSSKNEWLKKGKESHIQDMKTLFNKS